ncbi:hypothetical protein BDZ89DRAFT_1166691 [Hymenopellis radicata]|nr:hypothetical protein BDZ89DRAFT_1166691 [Hymenopellis radicata]
MYVYWEQASPPPPSPHHLYPPPITTTSPAPPDLSITLMTTHQKAQGYHSILNSMFCAKPPPLLYDAGMHSSKEKDSRYHGWLHQHYHHHSNSSSRSQKADVSRSSFTSRPALSRADPEDGANMLVNKETCGLLLGKDNKELVKCPARRRDAYVVTTLLISIQCVTCDTCAMEEEEESVLRFTEERHPTQTCMSVSFKGYGFIYIFYDLPLL